MWEHLLTSVELIYVSSTMGVKEIIAKGTMDPRGEFILLK